MTKATSIGKVPHGWRGPLRRIWALTSLAAVLGGAFAPSASAQTPYPVRPVKIVVPFAAGGVADITVRIVAEKLGDRLGQRFIIENMAGAGGVTAARAATSATPDGYTLAMLTNGTAISVPLFKSLPFNPVKDFAPISMLGQFDFIFAANAASEFKTLEDLLRAARTRPGDLNIATIAVGSTQHLTAVLLKSEAKVDFAMVPYRATPDALVALLRNDAHVLIDTYAALRSALEDKRIRALATSGSKRSKVLPDVPTAEEAGAGHFDVTSWNALFAPSGTPPAVIETLNRALREVLAQPDVTARLLDLGIEAQASSPEELGARLASDIAKWTEVIDKAGIQKQ
jgi:tripartite-type tricarboxylate transporter receptor subunit TctC